jgi:hypothetical protein
MSMGSDPTIRHKRSRSKGEGQARPSVGSDPQPVAPTPPGPDDCCHSGCTWCVLDLYQEELEKYREALKAWEARQKAQQR